MCERTLQQLRAEARVEGPQQGGALRLVASSLVLGSAFHAVLLPQDFSGGAESVGTARQDGVIT